MSLRTGPRNLQETKTESKAAAAPFDLDKEIRTLCKTGYVNDVKAVPLLCKIFDFPAKAINNNLLEYISQWSIHGEYIKKQLSGGAVYTFTLENKVYICFEKMDTDRARLIQDFFQKKLSLHVKILPHENLKEYWKNENKMKILDENGLIRSKIIKLSGSAQLLIFDGLDFFELLLKNITPAALSASIIEPHELVPSPSSSSSAIAHEGLAKIEMIHQELQRFLRGYKFMSDTKRVNEFYCLASTALGVNVKDLQSDLLEDSLLLLASKLSLKENTFSHIPTGGAGNSQCGIDGQTIFLIYKKMDVLTADHFVSVLNKTFHSLDIRLANAEEFKSYKETFVYEEPPSGTTIPPLIIVPIHNLIRLLRYIAIDNINQQLLAPTMKRTRYLQTTPIRENIEIEEPKEDNEVEIKREIEDFQANYMSEKSYPLIAKVLRKPVADVISTEILEKSLIEMTGLSIDFIIDGHAHTQIRNSNILVWYGNMEEIFANRFEKELQKMFLNVDCLPDTWLHNPASDSLTYEEKFFERQVRPRVYSGKNKGFVFFWTMAEFCKTLNMLSASRQVMDAFHKVPELAIFPPGVLPIVCEYVNPYHFFQPPAVGTPETKAVPECKSALSL